MSIRLMAAVWHGCPYSGTDLLLMLALADYCNDAGYCWPSMRELAQKTRLEDCRSMRRHLNKFRREGYLRRVHRPGKSVLTQLLIPASWYYVPATDPTRPLDGDTPGSYAPTFPHHTGYVQGGSHSPPSGGRTAPPPGVAQPPLRGSHSPPIRHSDPSGDPSSDPSPAQPARPRSRNRNQTVNQSTPREAAPYRVPGAYTAAAVAVEEYERRRRATKGAGQ